MGWDIYRFKLSERKGNRMSMMSELSKFEVRWPDVFTDPDFEYTGSERDKKARARLDLQIWKANCLMEKPDLEQFDRGMRKISALFTAEEFRRL